LNGAVLAVVAILTNRLYRTVKSILLLLEAGSESACETLAVVQEGFKPLATILELIQGILGGFESTKGLGNY
jgi:hypothetical protein